MVCQTDSASRELRYTTPFHFIISRTVASSNPDTPEHCLQLPPSLELGGLVVDDLTGKRFAQPSIEYSLRAAVTINIGNGNRARTIETSMPVILMPHTQEFPPTETKDFPAEFKERESKILRRSLIGGKLGKMNISIQEPPALTYDTLSTRSTTEALIKLELESTSSGDIHWILTEMTFTILSLIRVKTFYSIKAFPRLPSQSLLSLRGRTRLRDDLIKLETRTVEKVPWSYIFEMGSQVPNLSHSSTAVGDLVDGNSVHGERRSSTASLPSLEGRWTAVLNIPIRVDARLLPTFCSSLVARMYSVILRVKVSGIRKESFDLEIPLQVVHTPPDGLLSDQSQPAMTIAEPIREYQTILEFRSALATSWFSEQSLVRISSYTSSSIPRAN